MAGFLFPSKADDEEITSKYHVINQFYQYEYIFIYIYILVMTGDETHACNLTKLILCEKLSVASGDRV